MEEATTKGEEGNIQDGGSRELLGKDNKTGSEGAESTNLDSNRLKEEELEGSTEKDGSMEVSDVGNSDGTEVGREEGGNDGDESENKHGGKDIENEIEKSKVDASPTDSEREHVKRPFKDDMKVEEAVTKSEEGNMQDGGSESAGKDSENSKSEGAKLDSSQLKEKDLTQTDESMEVSDAGNSDGTEVKGEEGGNNGKESEKDKKENEHGGNEIESETKKSKVDRSPTGSLDSEGGHTGRPWRDPPTGSLGSKGHAKKDVKIDETGQEDSSADSPAYSDVTEPVDDDDMECEGGKSSPPVKSKEKEKQKNSFWSRDYYFRSRKLSMPRINRYSSDDTEEYRNGYPGKRDYPDIDDNYKFYTNQIPSCPNGDFIDNIHRDWWGNYRLLEFHHSYIQWLFPIRERGLNWHAQELQLHEIESICADKDALNRIVKSYEMMLDFYGLKLVDKDKGTVQRSDKWQERFKNLNESGHNYLRVTRILKCLGEFKLEHYKPPLIRTFLHEAITEGTLRNTLSSCVNYWIPVVKDDKEREELMKLAKKLIDSFNKEEKSKKK